MLRTFLNSFRVPEIRKKLAFTAGMLALYRVGAYIPAPGINIDAVKDIADNFTGSSVLGLLNVPSRHDVTNLIRRQRSNRLQSFPHSARAKLFTLGVQRFREAVGVKEEQIV